MFDLTLLLMMNRFQGSKNSAERTRRSSLLMDLSVGCFMMLLDEDDIRLFNQANNNKSVNWYLNNHDYFKEYHLFFYFSHRACAEVLGEAHDRRTTQELRL